MREPKRPKLVQRKPVACRAAASPSRPQESFDKGESSPRLAQPRLRHRKCSRPVLPAIPGIAPTSKAFLDNLQKSIRLQTKARKKGDNFAAFKGMGHKAKLKKSIAKGEFEIAIRAGLELLRLNPWEIPTLMQMATASAGLGCFETQLIYLNLAQKTAPDPGDDVEIDAACA